MTISEEALTTMEQKVSEGGALTWAEFASLRDEVLVLSAMGLQEDEIAYLQSAQERCDGCGHLQTLHDDGHCCDSGCYVGIGCGCGDP